METKKILFIIPSLRAGGAERVVTHLSNGLVKRGYKVSIILTKWNEIQYSINKEIDIYFIDKENATPIQQICFIRKKIRYDQKQTVISFITMQNLYTIIAAIGLKNKIIVSERNDPRKTVPNKLLGLLRNILYLRVYKIVFQTQDAKDYFGHKISAKGIIIGNPLSENLPKPYTGSRDKTLVTVARLEKQKNIPMLLEVCKNIFEKHPEYHLEIYGVGSLEQDLKQHVYNLGIASKVVFKGYQNSIPEKIKNASAFLLTSDYEGVSNAMLEALAIGVPCICTDCPIGGAKTYIKSMENGILVPVGDTEAFIKAVLKVIRDEQLQKTFSKNAVQIIDGLSLNNILKCWIELI